MAHKKFNKYKIEGDRTIIYVTNRLKEIMECYIDTKNLQKLLDMGYAWHTYWNKVNNTYYARCSRYLGAINGKSKFEMIYMHHFIKPIKKGEVVDHRDNNTLNNCEDNLRIVTQIENTKNRTTKNKNNTSGYRNVTWDKSADMWLVQISINKKNTRMGHFEDVHEAGKFAAKMRAQYYGEYQGNA
ncbi:HNH endonuclease [Brevibacillus porteri]|uniref:HNH endonuclease n=1 Tax=Brevibacillus porteri TaxID=2126350 RepID=UPI00362E2090